MSFKAYNMAEPVIIENPHRWGFFTFRISYTLEVIKNQIL